MFEQIENLTNTSPRVPSNELSKKQLKELDLHREELYSHIFSNPITLEKIVAFYKSQALRTSLRKIRSPIGMAAYESKKAQIPEGINIKVGSKFTPDYMAWEVTQVGEHVSSLGDKLDIIETFTNSLEKLRSPRTRQHVIDKIQVKGNECTDLVLQFPPDRILDFTNFSDEEKARFPSYGMEFESWDNKLKDLQTKYHDFRSIIADNHRKLVVWAARKFGPKKESIEDRIQYGYIGLMKAIDRYNYRLNYDFSAYATSNIRWEYSRIWKNELSLIRIPSNIEDLFSRSEKIRKRLLAKNKFPPPIREIADAAGISLNDYHHLLQLKSYTTGPYDEEQIWKHLTIGIHSLDMTDLPEYKASRRSIKFGLGLVLGTLTYKERDIIKLRYGIGINGKHTLEEVGKLFKLSRERVRQIEKVVLERLQTSRLKIMLHDNIY